MVDLGGGRGWLADLPARSIWRIDRTIGHFLQITEAGRDWAKQNEHYQRYLRYLSGGPWAPIALKPGTSVHEKGAAVDSNEAQRILWIMFEHGWRRTVYRDGKLVEPWHFEYFYNLDHHRYEPISATESSKPFVPNTPATPEEEPITMATGVIYTNDTNDQNRKGAIIDTATGVFSKFGWFTVDYADKLAIGFGSTKAAPVTSGQYAQIERDLAEQRARQYPAPKA